MHYLGCVLAYIASHIRWFSRFFTNFSSRNTHQNTKRWAVSKKNEQETPEATKLNVSSLFKQRKIIKLP
jgi:hypothetical protein